MYLGSLGQTVDEGEEGPISTGLASRTLQYRMAATPLYRSLKGLGAMTPTLGAGAAVQIGLAGLMLYMAYKKPTWTWTYLKVVGYIGVGVGVAGLMLGAASPEV